MIFIALIIYLVLLIPYFSIIIPLFGMSMLFVWASFPILFLISLLCAWSLMYLIYSFSQEHTSVILNITRIKGIRWLIFFTIMVSSLYLLIFTFENHLDYILIGIIVPLALVSFANAMNIELIPKFLIEKPNGKLVTPPKPKSIEIPEDIHKEYEWEYEEKKYKISLTIRNSVYENFKSKPRVSFIEWPNEYVINGICGEIRELANKLIQLSNAYGSYEEVSFVLSFVKNVITYKTEEGEYPKYPVETLVEQTGDCEDFTFLGAIILRVMGYDVAILSPPGHAALGIAGAQGLPGYFIEHEGKRFYYCEMTADGWKIGDIPEEYKDTKIDVLPIPPFQINIPQA